MHEGCKLHSVLRIWSVGSVYDLVLDVERKK